MKTENIKMLMAAALSVMPLCCGCSYEELPPKTDDTTTDYVLPKGEIPTQKELEAVAAAKEEYRNSTS